LDELRYEFACKSDKPASAFPPTEDAFLQHVLRAKYQLSIWMQCEVAKPHLVNPICNGWKWDEGTSSLQPIYYEKDAAPVEVRDLTHNIAWMLSATLRNAIVWRQDWLAQNSVLVRASNVTISGIYQLLSMTVMMPTLINACIYD
jgi:hypothetical protein